MNIEQFIQYFRDSCLVDNPEAEKDSEFIALTDEQLEMVLRISASKLKYTLDDMSDSTIYKTLLLSKKEIYYRLASKNAPLYDLKSETGELYRSNRFNHYYKLIEMVEAEYQNILVEEELNTDVSNTGSYSIRSNQGEVFLNSRYHSRRNYEHAQAPKIKLKVDKINPDNIEVSWNILSINKFLRYKLLINGSNNIIDEYEGNVIDPNSKELLDSTNIHTTKFRINGLEEKKAYSIAILVYEPNGLMGYSEVQEFTKEWVN